MIIVQQLLQEKGSTVWSVAPDTSLGETLKRMAEKDIGVVMVVEDEKVKGIFSERDFARKVAHSGSISLDTPVRELMTEMVYYVSPDSSIEDCMALMTEKRFRHLPVLESDRLMGLISIGDIVREIVEERDITIRSLENYILGREYNT